MKTLELLLVICAIGFMTNGWSQDVITFKNGEEQKAKVVEVGMTEIKYRKAENPDGPLYVVAKGTVFMIKYENGSRDVFAGSMPSTGEAQRGVPTMKGEIKGDYKSLTHAYHKNLAGGIVMTAVGAPLIPIGLGLSIAGWSESTFNGNRGPDNMGVDGAPMIVAGGLLLAAGITCVVVGPIKIKMAKRYKARARELGTPTLGLAPVVVPGAGGQAMKAGAGLRFNF